MAQNPQILVRNASKLLDKIKSDLNKELQKKITTLLKGIEKELNQIYKGVAVKALERLDNTSSTTGNVIFSIAEDGFRLHDREDVINQQKIKRITWDTGLQSVFSSNGRDVVTSFTATTEHNDITIECVLVDIDLTPL